SPGTAARDSAPQEPGSAKRGVLSSLPSQRTERTNPHYPGAASPGPASLLTRGLQRLDRRREAGHHFEGVADDAVVGALEDGRLGVLVDGDDELARAHAGQVLDRAADGDGDVELRRDGLAGLADLVAVRAPAGVDDGAAGADGGAERGGEVFDHR